MKPCILMTTEGTYPFLGGGVSTWCHELTQQMPEVDFKIMAIVANPYLSQQYPLSANVTQVLKVPLWGMEDRVWLAISVFAGIKKQNSDDRSDNSATISAVI
jgi:polysaccharide biosynthesis protein PelF